MFAKHLGVCIGILISFSAVSYSQVTWAKFDSPSTGSEVSAGSDQSVNWSFAGDSTAIIDLQYSTDNGYSWYDIGSIGVSAGSFNWSVPVGVSSTTCTIKMVNFHYHGYPSSVGVSGVFSISTVPIDTAGLEAYSHTLQYNPVH